MQEEITAALRQHGPCSRRALTTHVGVVSSTLHRHLSAMLAAGAVKAAGKTIDRRYGLPDQDLAAAAGEPPPPRSKGRKHKKRGKARAVRRAAAPRHAAPAGRFLATVDARSCLVLINGGAPQVFTVEQTQAIATLLLTHYGE